MGALVINYFDKSDSLPFQRVLILGLAKSPRKMRERKYSKVRAKHCDMKVFLKYVNINHLVPTRYHLGCEEYSDVIMAAEAKQAEESPDPLRSSGKRMKKSTLIA